MSKKAVKNVSIISLLVFFAVLFGMVGGPRPIGECVTTAISAGLSTAAVSTVFAMIFAYLDE